MGKVLYKKNSILESIIQIKFPQILALKNEDPIQFQSLIRETFPIYQLSIEKQHEIAFNIEKEPTLAKILQSQQIKNHNFISTDGHYKINLTSGFISISTVKYDSWESIIDLFSKPMESFLKIYQPPFFERVGLRYIDGFSKKKLNLETCSWRDLIAPQWLGGYNLIEDENKVLTSNLEVEYVLDDGISHAKIRSGLGMNNNEKIFLLDSDFIHIGNINIKDYRAILEQLHVYAKGFINAAITQKLHEAMEPEENEN